MYCTVQYSPCIFTTIQKLSWTVALNRGIWLHECNSFLLRWYLLTEWRRKKDVARNLSKWGNAWDVWDVRDVQSDFGEILTINSLSPGTHSSALSTYSEFPWLCPTLNSWASPNERKCLKRYLNGRQTPSRRGYPARWNLRPSVKRGHSWRALRFGQNRMTTIHFGQMYWLHL